MVKAYAVFDPYRWLEDQGNQVIFLFFNFAILDCIQTHLLLASQVLFLIMSKLWSVYCLEITVLVGWVLNSNN